MGDPIVFWTEKEIPRDPGVDGKVSEVPRKESDILQAFLVDDRGFDVSGIRGYCCRICSKKGRFPRES